MMVGAIAMLLVGFGIGVLPIPTRWRVGLSVIVAGGYILLASVGASPQ